MKRELTELEEYILIEMLRYYQYSPELFSRFGGPTVNAMWYPVLEDLYAKGLGNLALFSSRKRNIYNWVEKDRDRIENLFEGYLSHFFQVKEVLKELKIKSNNGSN